MAWAGVGDGLDTGGEGAGKTRARLGLPASEEEMVWEGKRCISLVLRTIWRYLVQQNGVRERTHEVSVSL